MKMGDTMKTGVQTKGRRKASARGCVAALAAAVALALAGCGNEGEPVEVSGEKLVDVSGEDLTGVSGENRTGDGGENPEAGGNDLAGAGGQQAAPGSTGGGYQFTVNGVTIAINEDAAPIIEQLGEPLSYFESESCAFQGLDKIYTYSAFELDTYPRDGKDYVAGVVLMDDSVATPEGIAIGDSLEKLKQAYSQEGEEVCSMVKYEKDGMTLTFVIQDDTVISIEYRMIIQ